MGATSMDRFGPSGPQGRLRATAAPSTPLCDQHGRVAGANAGRLWTLCATITDGSIVPHPWRIYGVFCAPGAAECYQRGRLDTRRYARNATTPILAAWTLRATSVDAGQRPVAARHPAPPGARFAEHVLPAWTATKGRRPLACPGASATSVDGLHAAANCPPCIAACYHCGRLPLMADRASFGAGVLPSWTEPREPDTS
jgi:hypothetical protein